MSQNQARRVNHEFEKNPLGPLKVHLETIEDYNMLKQNKHCHASYETDFPCKKIGQGTMAFITSIASCSPVAGNLMSLASGFLHFGHVAWLVYHVSKHLEQLARRLLQQAANTGLTIRSESEIK